MYPPTPLLPPLLLVLLVCGSMASSCSCPTVRYGSRGDCVQIVQRAVGVTADGVFGSNTAAAVQMFQRSQGLVADGIVRPGTWAAIEQSLTDTDSQPTAATSMDSFLGCLCQCPRQPLGCREDVGSLSCGNYQIKHAYYQDCSTGAHAVTLAWKACAQNEQCARNCVKNYMARYGSYCTRGSQPTFETFARIHNGGPEGCRYSWTIKYWNHVRKCLN